MAYQGPAKLFLNLVAPFEAFHSAGSINYFLLAGEEGMALATQLHSELLLGGAGSKGVATGADYLGIGVIFRMYFRSHLTCSV